MPNDSVTNWTILYRLYSVLQTFRNVSAQTLDRWKKFVHAQKFIFARTFCYVRQRPCNVPNACLTMEKRLRTFTIRFPKNRKTLGVRWPKRHGVTAPLVRRCCEGDTSSQWDKANLPLSLHAHALTDSHQILHTWLRQPYLSTCHIWSRSHQGLLPLI